MSRTPRALYAAVLATLLATPLATGCGVIHKANRAPEPPVTLPEAFSVGSQTSVAQTPWWSTFEASQLDELIRLALEGNLGLVQAFSRLDQAKAMLQGADAGYWPSITGEVSVSGSRNFFNPNVPAFTGAQYNASIAATYEVDLWGRVHSLSNAAELDYAATREDVDAAVMSLTAQVAETWFRLIEQNETEKLLLEQVKRNETQLELVELRFGQGLANAVDVFQQRQVLAASKTLLPPVRSTKEILQHTLALLIGRAPGSAVPIAPAGLPALPELPAVGLSADLLAQRPDVRSARLRVASADYRVGAALAARFPTLRLTASVGLRAFDLADILDNWLWNLVAGIAGPIFDGGRLAASQRLSEAQLRDQVAGYGQVVLNAFTEVEDALTREARHKEFIEELALQLEAARRTEHEAYARYVDGLADYLPVLTAMREVQGLERAQIAAQSQLLSFRIQLCRALGGTWMSKVERPGALSAKDGE